MLFPAVISKKRLFFFILLIFPLSILAQIHFEEIDHVFEDIRTSHVEFADVNGNGHLDVLLMGYRTLPQMVAFTGLYLNDGNGGFTLSDNPELIDLAYASAAFADIDGDGDLDLILSGGGNGVYTRVYLNDGNGYFTEAEDQPFGGANDVIFADFNGDGIPDLLVSNNAGKNVYLNDGNGNFTNSNEHDIFTSISSNYTVSIAVADVNGNGAQDILINGRTPEGEWKIYLFLNDGEAHFTEADISNVMPLLNAEMVLGDLNNDGYPDLLITGSDSSDGSIVMKLYMNDGNGNFSEVSHPFTPVNYADIQLADVDNDGNVDVLITGFSSTVRISELYKNNGNLNFTKVECLDFTPVNNASAAFADIDQDGDLDLIITGAHAPENGFVGAAITGLFMNQYVELNSLIPQADFGDEPVSLCLTDFLDATPSNEEEFDELSYEWHLNDNLLQETSSQITISQSGTYTVKIEGTIYDCNGEVLISNIAEYNIDVNDSAFNVDLGEDKIVCDEDFIILTANIEGGSLEDVEYEWTKDNVILEENSSELLITESGVYTVEISMDGCVETASIIVEFYNLPIADLGPDIQVEELSDIFLDATPENFNIEDVFFEWFFDDGTGDFPLPEDGPVVDPQIYGFGVYTVIIYAEHPDCFIELTIEIEQEEVVCSLELTPDQALEYFEEFCLGNKPLGYSIEFKANFFISSSVSDELIYFWYKNNMEIEGVHGDTFILNYDEEGTFSDEITVKVQHPRCEASATVQTHVEIIPFEYACQLPEGISPGNNDGFNDYLDLQWLNERSGIKYFRVFNRYGLIVYEKKQYINEWHGQDRNGKKLPSGTYYYSLEFEIEDPVFGRTHTAWIYVNQSHY